MAEQPGGLNWSHLTAEAINDAIRRLGLHYEGDNDVASKQAWLTGIGIHPIQCLHLPTQHAPPVVRIPRLDLAQQNATETVRAFVDRAEATFEVSNLTDAQMIATLLNAALPPAAETIIAYQSRHPGASILDVLTELRTRFRTPSSTAGVLFSTAAPQPGESLYSFGRRLLSLYLDFLDKPLSVLQDHEDFIKPPLFLRLLSILPKPAQAGTSHPQCLLQHPTIRYLVRYLQLG
jgi:hypothetical protein